MVYKSLLLLKSNINMTIPHFNLPQRICLLPCVLQLRLKALAATVPHCDLHDESQTPSLTTTSILISLSNFDSIITVRGQIVNNQNRNSICECVWVFDLLGDVNVHHKTYRKNLYRLRFSPFGV